MIMMTTMTTNKNNNSSSSSSHKRDLLKPYIPCNNVDWWKCWGNNLLCDRRHFLPMTTARGLATLWLGSTPAGSTWISLWYVCCPTLCTYIFMPIPPVEHRPSMTPRHCTLFWAALIIPDQLVPWSIAASALLQCLASNCCETCLSFSSLAGSRSGLGV